MELFGTRKLNIKIDVGFFSFSGDIFNTCTVLCLPVWKSFAKPDRFFKA